MFALKFVGKLNSGRININPETEKKKFSGHTVRLCPRRVPSGRYGQLPCHQHTRRHILS